MADRIEIVVDGELQAALPTRPVDSSNSSPWRGFTVERHALPPVEMPDHYIPSYIVNVIFCPSPGTIYWTDSGRERHSIRANEMVAVRSPGELRGCRWDFAWSMLAVEAPHGRDVELFPDPGRHDPVMRHLVQSLVAELNRGCPVGPLLGESICTNLALALLQHYSVYPVQVKKYRGGISRARLKNVLEYIDAFLSRNLSVEELAQIAGMSRYHFGKLFKQSTGTTLHQYVLARRIDRAKYLLSKPRGSLVDIGAEVGLPNQSHFTSVFQKATGIPPGIYRGRRRGPT